MNTKRIISLVASLALVLSLSVGLTGCGDKAAQDDNQGSTDGEGTKYTVGICQLVQHEALDAATQGFIDALNEALPGQVEFQNKNASGDNANCSTIVNGFVSDGVDLIMANATPALTAAAAATSDIPILGTSITAYGVALDIDDFNGTVGGNISGTSDLADLEAQANMITEWFPEAKKVGLLFCSAESNSDIQIAAAKEELDALGIAYDEYAVSSSNEIQSVVESAVGKVDALYSPTDNTIAAGASQVGQICKENKLPFVTGEEGMCMAGGLFTLSINYEDLGYAAGEMAVKILKGEAKPEDMAIKHLSSKDLVVVKNDEMAEALGIDLSALDE